MKMQRRGRRATPHAIDGPESASVPSPRLTRPRRPLSADTDPGRIDLERRPPAARRVERQPLGYVELAAGVAPAGPRGAMLAPSRPRESGPTSAVSLPLGRCTHGESSLARSTAWRCLLTRRAGSMNIQRRGSRGLLLAPSGSPGRLLGYIPWPARPRRSRSRRAQTVRAPLLACRSPCPRWSCSHPAPIPHSRRPVAESISATGHAVGQEVRQSAKRGLREVHAQVRISTSSPRT